MSVAMPPRDRGAPRAVSLVALAGILKVCTVAAQVPVTPAAPDGYLAYTGTATLRHAPRFVYGERHVLEYRGGSLVARVVLYTCADGAPFARKIVDYVDRVAPDFELDDASHGLREGVRSAAGGRAVFFRQSSGEAERSAPVPAISPGLANPGLVIDAGFDEFVRGNWTRLLAGESLRMHFLVPSRLQAIDFQVQHLRSEVSDGRPAEIFRLTLSGFWGWILPSIDVTYGADDRVLLRYDGLSDLRDGSNDNYKVLIRFPSTDRRSSSAAAMQAARTARLAPCR
jgi:hypothetical protein